MNNRRAVFRQNLHALYLPYYDELCKRLPEQWQPVEGYRTFDRQETLYAIGRTKKGTPVTRALPGESLHNYGLASDWGYVEYPNFVDLPPADNRWHEYIDTCTALGLRLIPWDKPHNEYRFKKTNIHQLFDAWKIYGMKGVNQLLEEESKNG
jgi:hypothetical protein